MKLAAIPFTQFAADVLRLRLTTGQRAWAMVALDDRDPIDLPEPERTIALKMYGGAETVPAGARRIQCHELGRNSGKTTLSAGGGLYSCLTADLSTCGPGDVPVDVTVAPDKKTAALAVRMALEMARAAPALARMIESEGSDGFTIRRPDGRLVAFEAFAASRGGSSVRGRTIISARLDEAQFFRSDEANAVTDRDMYRAIVPRLIGRMLFISTPWPVDTLMAELVAKNYGNPVTALASRAPTLVMRDNDPDLAERISSERARDPENASREFECAGGAGGTGTFFDPLTIDRAIDPHLYLPATPTAGAMRGRGMDLGLTHDSAAHAIVECRGALFTLVQATELRPKKGAPLKLSEVVETFAKDRSAFDTREVMADGWCREPAREWTDLHKLIITPAPEGQNGKRDTFVLVKTMLSEGRLVLPAIPRLTSQLKSVVSKPTPGGGVQISVPRRAGQGHGDLMSAVVLAVWHANDRPTPIRKPTRTHGGGNSSRWGGMPGRGFG